MDRAALRADAARRAQAALAVTPVPDYPGWFVRGLTAGELDREAAEDIDDTKRRGMVRMAMLLACTESGERVFEPADRAEVDALPFALVAAINKAGNLANGRGPEGEAAAGNG